MRILIACVFLIGCSSDAQTACNDEAGSAANRVSACGEACAHDAKACKTQSDIGLAACFDKHDAEVCRWMCHYGTTSGKDLYCAEYKKQTGKEAE